MEGAEREKKSEKTERQRNRMVERDRDRGRLTETPQCCVCGGHHV